MSMEKRRNVLIVMLLVLAAVLPLPRLRAQSVAVSADVAQCAFLGTMNLELSWSVAQHWTLSAGARVNPWTFSRQDPQTSIQARQTSFSLGTRWWPWHAFSGWWVGIRAQYTPFFSTTGVWRPALATGSFVGGGLSFGYMYMLTRHLNIEAALGGVGGWMPSYTLYYSAFHPDVRDAGPRWFIAPELISVTLCYVF